MATINIPMRLEIEDMISCIEIHHLSDSPDMSAIEQANLMEKRERAPRPEWSEVHDLLKRALDEINELMIP